MQAVLRFAEDPGVGGRALLREVPVPGRLRGQGDVLGRGRDAAVLHQNQPPRNLLYAAGEPRVPAADVLLQLPARMYASPNPGLSKHDQEVYEVFTEMFDVLPIAAVINRKFFAVHGGISPRLTTVLATLLRKRMSRRSTGSRSRPGAGFSATCCGRTPSQRAAPSRAS